MPTDEQFLQLVADISKEHNSRPDYLGWGSIVFGLLAAILSFWANNAIMGERVARLQTDMVEIAAAHAALVKHELQDSRESDKSIAALRQELKDLIYKEIREINRNP